NRLDDADFVVRGHDRDQQRPLGERFGQPVERDEAVRFDREVSDAKPLALELNAAFEHTFVLSRQGYDVIARLPALQIKSGEMRSAFDRQVVRLGGARGEYELARIGV